MAPRPLLLAAMLLVGSAASAQDPDGRSGRGSEARQAPERISDPYEPSYSSGYSHHSYRSRTAPRPSEGDSDSDYGFRNPGGVGRMEEYYPPGDSFEKGQDAVRVAKFEGGPPSTSRNAQFRAQMVGNARTRTLERHIDAYARPFRGGWGFGFGFR